ncbi:DNA-binding protein [Komagataeibacter melaceti]|mgnify:CR=1 FL=1|uniref:DNA-binding protein n=1 Tax=Komagataeibacter melaceti TaxID=2766577 RepID=A0A371YYU9_9PROT|nr:DNA-binding protein [Komagataeibacter melaceti]RFD19391.1 DNA-binding protein [Komagataeibacter melaceti]
MFPLKRMLPLREAAEYVGITLLRLRCLRLVRAGPHAAMRNGREVMFRIEDLDDYVDRLYRRANISHAEQARHRNAWRARLAALPVDARGRISDSFMQILTRDDFLETGANRGFRVLFFGGLCLIFLSHTPLIWRL